MNTLKFAIALILIFAGNAYAGAEYDLVLDKLSPAWQRLDSLSQGYLTVEQQKTVQELAFAAAAGDICTGLEVDQEKFVEAFKLFDDDAFRSLSAEGKLQQERKLLVLYGMATGLFAAEGLLAKEEFCAAAEDVRSTAESHYWKNRGSTAAVNTIPGEEPAD